MSLNRPQSLLSTLLPIDPLLSIFSTLYVLIYCQLLYIIISFRAAAQRGPWPPHSWGF